MSLREQFQNSKRKRVRDLTVEGIGGFKLLVPSAAASARIRADAKAIDSANEAEWLSFIGSVVVRYVVDDNLDRAYGDDEVAQLLEDIDPFALMEIYAKILTPKSPDEAIKNSDPTPNDTQAS